MANIDSSVTTHWPETLNQVAAADPDKLNPIGQIAQQYLVATSADIRLLVPGVDYFPTEITSERELSGLLQAQLLFPAVQMLGELNSRVKGGIDLSHVTRQRVSDLATPQTLITYEQTVGTLRKLGIISFDDTASPAQTSGLIQRLTTESGLNINDAYLALSPYIAYAIIQAGFIYVPKSSDFRDALKPATQDLADHVKSVTLPILLRLMATEHVQLLPAKSRPALTAVPDLPIIDVRLTEDASEAQTEPRFERIQVLDIYEQVFLSTTESSALSRHDLLEHVRTGLGLSELSEAELRLIDNVHRSLFAPKYGLGKENLFSTTKVDSKASSGPRRVNGYYRTDSSDTGTAAIQAVFRKLKDTSESTTEAE